MTNTDTATTAGLTDAQLAEVLTRYVERAEKTIADVKAQIAADDTSIVYAAQWRVGDAVRAEATLRIYRTALDAPRGQMREALAHGIASAMSADGRSTDPWANAADAETREAGRLAFGMWRSEIDTDVFVARLA